MELTDIRKLHEEYMECLEKERSLSKAYNQELKEYLLNKKNELVGKCYVYGIQGIVKFVKIHDIDKNGIMYNTSISYNDSVHYPIVIPECYKGIITETDTVDESDKPLRWKVKNGDDYDTTFICLKETKEISTEEFGKMFQTWYNALMN